MPVELRASVLTTTDEAQLMALSKPDRRKINAFFQTAIDGWREQHGAKPFSLADLMGGTGWEWEGGPLWPLWQREKNKGKHDQKAQEYAHKAARNMLKQVVFKDAHNYLTEVKHELKLRLYSWDGKPPTIIDPEEEAAKHAEAQRQRARKANAARRTQEATEAKAAARAAATQTAAEKAQRKAKRAAAATAAPREVDGNRKASPQHASRKKPVVITKKKRRIIPPGAGGNR